MSETATVETPVVSREIHPDQPVSIEIDGRILTGAGGTAAELQGGLPAPSVDPPVQPEKQTRGQKRFSRLVSERDQEAHQRAEVERERDELRARIAALESRSQTPAPTPAAVSPVAPVSQPVAKFSFPTFDAAVASNPSMTWDDWNDEKIAARARWEYRQSQTDIDARIRQSIEADRASRAFSSTVSDMLRRGQTVYPDFDAIRQNGPGVHVTLGPTDAIGAQRVQLIASLPNAEHVFYAVAKDAQVAQALARMSDVQFGMAIQAITPSAAVAPSASTAQMGSVIPPPPMQPVGSGSKTAVPSAADIAERAGEDYDSSGFREQKRKERGRR